ncbi:MazG-like family protein [Frankia sp. CcI49]|uniref:MazG-like family protein n=1 Tax=Frankia sp. CcI49 TaxID=1745382 RepID=UPI000A002B30|nr:MazG-like family protein [Frankia sp. CcI49]
MFPAGTFTLVDVLPNSPASSETAALPEAAVRPEPMLPTAAIDAAVRALDLNDRRMAIGPDEGLALRVVKVAEECGEASAALIGLRGQNPRKSRGSEQELIDELLDVALSALVAAASTTGDWAARFTAHVEARTARLIAAVGERHPGE